MTEEQRSKIVDFIRECASQIRNDWSDPRYQCRCIWEACDVLNGKPDRYEQLATRDSSVEEYIKMIDEALEGWE